MRVMMITPAPPSSRSGNRATAVRWRDIFEALGHEVSVDTRYADQDADLMVALHAWRSADSIAAFAARFPDRPLIVAITGTDAYRFIHSHPEPTLRSIRLATRLVGLHDLIGLTLPESERHKLTVIHQSAETVGPRAPFKGFFHVAVIGHLRDEKDPLRPALAARELPADSRIQVHQYGKAHTAEWAEQAGQEAAINPRYRWHGEVTRPEMTEVYRRTNLVVLPSLMEGGANVISEAVVAGAPVLASNIPGSIGLLGPDYPGYYPVGDATALAGLLWRAESEAAFLKELEAGCERLRSLFSPQREAASWAALLDKVC